MKLIKRRTFFKALVVLAAGSVLSACGRKNAPKHPEGSVHPRKYPYDDKKTTE